LQKVPSCRRYTHKRRDRPKLMIMESISEAFDRFFGRLPDWLQMTLYAIFSILCDA